MQRQLLVFLALIIHMNIGDIYGGLVRVAPPSTEPLTLGQAEAHLHVISDSGGEQDIYIGELISLAREYCENVLRRAVLTQSWRFSLKQFPGRDYQNWSTQPITEPSAYNKTNFIKLPMPPLQSVTTFTYRTSDGTVKSMTNANFAVLSGFTYNVEIQAEPGRIYLPFAGIWPTDILMPGLPIQIEFISGYVDISQATSPPQSQTLQFWEGYRSLLHAMKMLIGYWYENRIAPSEIRKSNVPAGEDMIIQELLMPHRIFD